MKGALIVTLLTILRLGVPAMIILFVGELARRQSNRPGNLRGAM